MISPFLCIFPVLWFSLCLCGGRIRRSRMTFLKLVKKKELWVPTCWGWVLIVFTIFVIVAGYMRNIDSFLSVSEPVQAQILAVEEWIPPYAIESAASEF